MAVLCEVFTLAVQGFLVGIDFVLFVTAGGVHFLGVSQIAVFDIAVLAALVCIALGTFSINLLLFVSNGFFVLADVCVVTSNGAVVPFDFPIVLANLCVVLFDLVHRAGLGKCSYTHQREQASKQD